MINVALDQRKPLVDVYMGVTEKLPLLENIGVRVILGKPLDVLDTLSPNEHHRRWRMANLLVDCPLPAVAPQEVVGLNDRPVRSIAEALEVAVSAVKDDVRDILVTEFALNDGKLVIVPRGLHGCAKEVFRALEQRRVGALLLAPLENFPRLGEGAVILNDHAPSGLVPDGVFVEVNPATFLGGVDRTTGRV